MNLFHILSFVALSVARPSEPVAIIYSLTGTATLAAPAARPLHRLDRLPSGAAVEVGPASRLALAFTSGARYELGAGSRVTLGTADLALRTGSVRELPRVPPFPILAAIAEEDQPGPRAGAVRIRSERITGLYPRHGAAVLAGEIRLRFQPVAGATSYRIEIQDDQGRTVFRADTESSPVKVPAGLLRAGLGYRWTIRTLDRPGPVARGDAELVILDEDAEQRCEAAHEILESERPDSLPLRAEIDRSLGLLLEAREELQAALDNEPGDSTLRAALAEIATQLEDCDDPR